MKVFTMEDKFMQDINNMDNMIQMDIWTIKRADQGNVVILYSPVTELTLPVFIGEDESRPVLYGCDRGIPDRPFIHDVFLKILGEAGFSIIRAEIYDLKAELFVARLFFLGKGYTGKNPLVLEVRPGDALALVIRSKCPLYVYRHVLDEIGLPRNFIQDEIIGIRGVDPVPAYAFGKSGGPGEAGAFDSEKDKTLEEQLQDAVAEEDYERAAELRDILSLLDEEKKKRTP
jgi:bifunctional DNase/RNase